ncbi:hypothetical protein Trydic_g19046 [Trypoxylus dichotomus]
MQLILIATLLSVAVAEKLNNVYLPPSNARTAGGSATFLSTPFARGGVFAPVIRTQAPQLIHQTQQGYYSKPVQITRYINDNNGDGTYQFDYETENRISQHEVGQLKNAGSNQESSVVHGSFSYAAPDGQLLTVDYVADENGFRPSGAHLPTPPPIPDAILRSIQLNAATGAVGSNDDGQYRRYDSISAYNQNGGYRY